ncbi:MAG: dihydrolipoyl dehydrogenase family protein [Salibacteraceae bacterium]
MKHYDLCIVGAGPSGFAAAMRAIDLGKKTCLIERKKLGGAGIFNGALSSKTMWELSQNYQMMKSSKFGYYVYDSHLSYSAVVHETKKAVNERYQQLKSQIDFYVKNGKLDFVTGTASMVSPTQISISNKEEEISNITADHTILAIGSRPRYLPQIPIDEEIIYTSDGILTMDKYPESIVILGAGVIGCEFATIFSNFGKTKVFLIDKAPRILPFEDADISDMVASNLTSNGVHIHKGASLESMIIEEGKVKYTLAFDDGTKEIRVVDKALISVGRVPNSENMGLKEIGVELNNRGYCVDQDTQTTVPNIYAIGDFTADIALVNIAELEGRHAVELMFNPSPPTITYDNISTIMFLNPEVASVGINETQAKQKGIAIKVAKMSYDFMNRAIAMRQKKGFIKLIVSDDDEMTILGMRVLGAHASSTIEAIALLISMKKSVRVLAELIHAHPSIPEGIQECARMLLGNSIVKPEVFTNGLTCYSVKEDGTIKNL